MLMRQIGDLLKDWRRINVSFTRAKAKLVIFGSRSTLKGDKLLDEFLQLMESQRWIYALPPGAGDLHSSRIGGAKNGEADEPSTKVEKAEKDTKASGVLASRFFAKDVLAVRIDPHSSLRSSTR
jgi:DNA replication ATP-dependent helicase Dna2